MLCGDCLDFARNPAILNAPFGCTLKSSWTACKASASEGCELRLLIKGHYDGPGEKKWPREDIVRDEPLTVRKSHNSTLAVAVPRKAFGTQDIILDTCATFAKAQCLANLFSFYRING